MAKFHNQQKEVLRTSYEGIHTFNYWLKKFKSQNKNSKPGFTEFKIIAKSNTPIILLNYPNGIVAELPSGCDYGLVHFLINNCQ